MSKNVGTANVKLRKAKLSEAKLCYVNLSQPEEEEHREQEQVQEHNQDQQQSRTDDGPLRDYFSANLVWILTKLTTIRMS